MRGDTPSDSVGVHHQGYAHERDRHLLCQLSRAAEVEVAEPVGDELQAPEMDGLEGVEGSVIPVLATAIEGELRVLEAGKTPASSSRGG